MDLKLSPREAGVPSSPASHRRTSIPEPLRGTPLLPGKCTATSSKVRPSCYDGDRRNHKSHTPTEPRPTPLLPSNTEPTLLPHSSTRRGTRPGAPVSSLGKALGSRRHLSSGWREKCDFQRTAPPCGRPCNPQGRSADVRQALRPGPPRPTCLPTGASVPSWHWCFSHLPVTPLVTVPFPQHVARHVTPGSGRMQSPALR